MKRCVIICGARARFGLALISGCLKALPDKRPKGLPASGERLYGLGHALYAFSSASPWPALRALREIPKAAPGRWILLNI